MKKVIINQDGIDVEYKLASFWAVIGSSFIDVLTLLVFSTSLIPILIFGFPFVYNEGRGLINSFNVETWGHRLFKIKRLGIFKSSKISLGTEFLRFFGFVIMGVGLLPFFITKNRQCLHDLISKTVVVDINCKGSKTWPNGDKYVGELKDGMMHGIGVFTFSDGETFEGLWENDESINN